MLLQKENLLWKMSAGLTWGIKMEMCGRAAWPSPSPSCGISLVHSRLQITSPKAAPELVWVTLHQLPASSSMSQTRSDSLPRTPRPFGGWWQGRVCSQLLPWPCCREALRARPICSCTLRAHTSPQTAWRSQFSTHLLSSEQTWELSAHVDHKTRAL